MSGVDSRWLDPGRPCAEPARSRTRSWLISGRGIVAAMSQPPRFGGIVAIGQERRSIAASRTLADHTRR